ncbi:MAG: prolyl oligopeptidase family serine peptidase [Oscillospiraceae bacterium]|nr:prolyl oligopeptidase family serine peptidase [Oscillospiraceae bacterium]
MTAGRYHGFRQVSFLLDGFEAVIVFPEKPEPRRRWVWRAEFLGAFDTVDVALLREGWHLLYYRISDRYGSPKAVALMDNFYRYAVEAHGLHPKPAIFGFSRGGLYTVAFAGSYPDRAGAIYLDAAVADITHWPLRPGYDSHEKAQCITEYELAPGAADTPDNPVYLLPNIIAAKIPLVMVAGLADEAVDYTKNGGPIVEQFQAAGIPVSVHLKPDCGHHPHSLEEPAPIAEFLREQIL